MRCILVRHGQSLFNAGETMEYDSDVTERGHHQIQEEALHAKEYMGMKDRFHTFKGFVSPYLRTLRTAVPIHDRWGVPFLVDLRVGEFPETVKTLRYQRLPYRYKEFLNFNWDDYPINGFEPEFRNDEIYWNDLKQFVKEIPEDSIVVSHMTTIQDLAGLLTGVEGTRKMPVPNCSVTYVEDGELMFIGQR